MAILPTVNDMPGMLHSGDHLHHYTGLSDAYRKGQISQMSPGKIETRSFGITVDRPSPRQMIAMRMHWPPNQTIPFPYLDAYAIDINNVAVFLVHQGEAMVLHDDASLFPSDTLITQLRTLLG